MQGSLLGRNASLDACYGDNHSSVYPSTVYLHLFVSDPTQGGIELTSSGGYAPLAVINNSANFPNAVGGFKSNGAILAFADPTAAWSGPADYFWLADSDTSLVSPGAPTLTTGGTPGVTPYYYKITALNAVGETTASGAGVITTGNAVLSGSDFNILAWAPVSGAASYNIYRSIDNVNFFLIDNVASTSDTDTGLTAGTQTPPVSNTTLTLLDGGPLQTPIIVAGAGAGVAIPVGALVITTN